MSGNIQTRALAIFMEAIEKPQIERAAFVQAACGGDEALRAEVQSLLDSHARAGAGDFLGNPTAGQAPPTQDMSNGPLREGPGAMIGPYKLLQLIGEGGFGSVFMAEQETPVRRKVALKIIKLGMDTKQVIARFEAERQALALMDHPNIARVLDVGATVGGRPYFVMELIKGIPITTYCDRQRLQPKARIELFIPVCQAVQHAHQKGVIHRDLKPTNILVTTYDGRPVPKVIDFGVAKAMGANLTEHTLFTGFGAVVGTLEYMSPEQAELNQLDVDTRSDIYSLGVLLYELLTGTTPLEAKTLRAAAMAEVLRLIREDEPPRPSTRLSTSEQAPSVAANRGLEPRKLSGIIRGELDWIVMKCLEKDRTRRYQTANGLVRDLERHLADEPVEASSPSALYRLRKLSRKYRTPLRVAAGFALLLIAATVISVWQAVRAQRFARTAEERRQRAISAEAVAETDRATAAAQEGIARHENYYASIALASNFIQTGSIDRAIKVLMDCPEQYRNWEWGRCMFLCHQQTLIIPVEQNVRWLRFSDDNRRLGMVDTRGILTLWDLEEGRPLIPNGDTSVPVNCLAFTSDSRHLVTGDRFGTVTVRSAQTGVVEYPLAGHAGAVYLLDTGTDPTHLVTAGVDGTVRIWDLTARRSTHVVTPPFKPLYFLSYSVDGRHIGIRGGSAAMLIDADAGNEVCPVHVPPGQGWRADVEAKHWARIEGSRVRLWDSVKGIETRSFSLPRYEQLLGADFSPDGNRLFCHSKDLTHIYDVESAEELAMRAMSVRFGGWSMDGQTLAMSASDNMLTVWRPGGDAVVLKGHTAPIVGFEFSPDGRRIATVADDHTVQVWTTSLGRTVEPMSKGAASVAISTSGRLIAAGQNPVRVVDAATGRALYSLPGHFGWVMSVAFSPDERRLATVATDKRLKVWDMADGRDLFTAAGHTRTIMRVAYSPRGDRIATASFDGTARIWDAATGAPLLTLAAGVGLTSVAFSPDGARVATSTRDVAQGMLWDAYTGQKLKTWSIHSRDIRGLAFSPDGRRIATGGSDGILRLWDADSLVQTSQLRSRSEIWGLSFGTDSARLVVANTEHLSNFGHPSFDVFDLAAGREVLSLVGESGSGTGVAFARDGRAIASCGFDSDTRLWEAFPWHDAEYTGRLGSPLSERILQYASSYWRQRLASEARAAEVVRALPPWRPDPTTWPRRSDNAGPEQLDLTQFYNGLLDAVCEPFSNYGTFDHDLSDLPAGSVALGGIHWDVRGLVQLAGSDPRWTRNGIPGQVTGIQVGRRAARIHFLHASRYSLEGQAEPMCASGTQIGSYVFHYADGSNQEMPIEQGRDLANWFWPRDRPPHLTSSRLVWQGSDRSEFGEQRALATGLYESTWNNPTPETKVASIDFNSKLLPSSPFLVAITVDPVASTSRGR